MAKKKQTKTKSKKMSGSSKKSAARTKKVLKPKKAAKKSAKQMARSKKASVKKLAGANRRKFRRYPTRNLWVTELAGEYQFVVPAVNISEGGIFLNGRMKTEQGDSELMIPMGDQGSLRLPAKAIYDRLAKGSYGAGYEFSELSATQLKALRAFLRNLD